MVETELFSGLVGTLYDAALDPSLCAKALRQAAAYVGGVSASVYAKNIDAKTGVMFQNDGAIDQRYVDLYFEKYVKLDPMTPGLQLVEVGEPISTNDVIPYDDFLKTRFYKEWGKPQHLCDHLSVVLDRSAADVALFGVFRHEREGLVDEPMRRRMSLIAPHVRRVVRIGRVIDFKSAATTVLTSVLDGIAAGVILMDKSGSIVHANVAAAAMLQAKDVLHAIEGRLRAADPQADHRLWTMFSEVAREPVAIIEFKTVSIPIEGRDGKRYVAHILPLTSGARRAAAKSLRAVAALFVQSAAFDAPAPPTVLAKAYGLTPTEMRVLLTVVEMGDAPAAAAALGMARQTVKTHLRSLYAKTGAHRQADLVKLFAAYMSPLVPSEN
jgi:DNA-binding CsgD family transcriptional regulator